MEKRKSSPYVGKFLEKDYNQFKDGILELLDDYKRKSERLDKIIKQSDKIQLKLLEANEELDKYKNSLEQKVEEEIKKREEKENLLLQQSKFAALGEMIDAIAHQWAQPLNILNMYNQSLMFDYENNEVDEEYIKNYKEQIALTIEHMNSTLIEFRSFFKTEKTPSKFPVKKLLDDILCLLKDELIKEKIVINIQIIDNFKINAIENEFKHILLNIINNSKDAFNLNKIGNKIITIKAYTSEGKNYLELNDNAGGIKEEILDKIFNVNFTTKGDKGSGIGLYMSELIAQKNNTSITAKNIENGASFILENKTLI